MWAEVIEDLDEPVVDDIDTNKTADVEGGDGADEWALAKNLYYFNSIHFIVMVLKFEIRVFPNTQYPYTI